MRYQKVGTPRRSQRVGERRSQVGHHDAPNQSFRSAHRMEQASREMGLVAHLGKTRAHCCELKARGLHGNLIFCAGGDHG